VARVLIFLLVVVLGVWAILDVAQTPISRVHGLSKSTWSLVVLVPLLGAAAWFLHGRVPATTPPREQPRPLAPDDDPDFLRRLGDDPEHRGRSV
jgi:hypothetical protein